MATADRASDAALSTAPDAPPSVLSPAYRSTTLGLVVLISFVAFEGMAVSTAMPVAARALGGIREYGLAFSLFMTTSLLGMVLAGGWADRSGPRRPILLGMLAFAVGLLVSGTATTFSLLLLGRAVAGFGGGLLMVAIYVVVASAFPQVMQPRVFSAMSGAWVLPSLVGPSIAGFLATQVSWRAVFLVVPPLVLLALVPLWPRLRAAPGATRTSAAAGAPSARRQGLRGLGLAVGATVLQWGLQGGGGRLVVAVLAVAVGGALALVNAPALLPPGTLRLRRGLPSVVLTRAALAGCFIGADTFVPLMLVEHRGLTPTLAGVTLTAGAIGWFCGSWIQGHAGVQADRFRLLVIGIVIVTLAVALLALSPVRSVPVWLITPLWIGGGLGMGIATASTGVLTLRLAPPGEEGRSSSGLQIADAMGTVLGVGIGGAVFAALHTPDGDDTRTFTVMWLVLALVGVAGIAAAVRSRPARSGAAAGQPAGQAEGASPATTEPVAAHGSGAGESSGGLG